MRKKGKVPAFNRAPMEGGEVYLHRPIRPRPLVCRLPGERGAQNSLVRFTLDEILTPLSSHELVRPLLDPGETF